VPPHEKSPPDSPLNINPDDVAVFLAVKTRRSATWRELSIAKTVEDAMKADPKVRAYVEELLRLEDPAIHPERYPSAN